MFAFAGLAIALVKGTDFSFTNFLDCSELIVTICAFVGSNTDDLSFVTLSPLGIPIRFCGVSGSSRFFLGVWITCVAFDVSAFALLLINALAKPRGESERLLGILYRDGVVFFLVSHFRHSG